jgi:hypothetical protein
MSNLDPRPLNDQDLTLQDLQQNFMDEEQTQKYYAKLSSPKYKENNTTSEHNKPYYRGVASTQDILNSKFDTQVMEKLNYMIHLMEEQQDQRTNTVTEEVVLYSFLGVFIIFIVDSFARVGKYTR